MERKAQTAVEPGGGRRWTEDEARAALAELAQSRESVAAFTQSRGYSAQRIRYWKKRLGETGAIPAFVSVRWPAVASTSSVPRSLEILVGGVTLRVREDLDVEHVARLVEALASRARGC